MQSIKSPYLQFTLLVLLLCIIACNTQSLQTDIIQPRIVTDPDDMDESITETIKYMLKSVVNNQGKIDDSVRLHLTNIVNDYYTDNDYEPVWSSEEKWLPFADSLYRFIKNAELEGLFPKDYHFKSLKSLKTKLDTDSAKRMDALLWSKADIMLTDAFMRVINDLKIGRLKADSVSLNADSILNNEFFVEKLSALVKDKQFTNLITSLQPLHKGYWDLKKGLKSFVDSMDRHTYTYVPYPFKTGDEKDSIFFVKTLQKRLSESGTISATAKLPDSAQLYDAIKKYQRQKKLKVDGRVTASLIRLLNTSDAEKFKRIALTLDRYKQLPDTFPQKYIWVNIPTYTLCVMDYDTVALESRVIVGKSDTRTPVLNSSVKNMVTYPTWTVPNSIIVKQYLPKLKNNPNYLTRLGLRLVTRKGKEVNPNKVNWEKYTVGIPYKVIQGSGDNNALGIFKFNFDNPYAVYLHDTNQRYLFKNGYRALSHGCVRVKEWQKLAFYIAVNDSLNTMPADSLHYTTDSIKNWVSIKENRTIDVKNQIPIYIRYFGCEGKDGKIKFYEDIYGEDKAVREKYFSDKSL